MMDVRKCEYYRKNGKCSITHSELYGNDTVKFTNCNCCEWDCDYKQLQQANKRIEELKTALKNKSMHRCAQCGSEYINPVGLELTDDLMQANKRIKELNEKNEQKLKQIEEIIQQIINEKCITGCSEDDKECTPENCIIKDHKEKCKQIQQIIKDGE